MKDPGKYAVSIDSGSTLYIGDMWKVMTDTNRMMWYGNGDPACPSAASFASWKADHGIYDVVEAKENIGLSLGVTDQRDRITGQTQSVKEMIAACSPRDVGKNIGHWGNARQYLVDFFNRAIGQDFYDEFSPGEVRRLGVYNSEEAFGAVYSDIEGRDYLLSSRLMDMAIREAKRLGIEDEFLHLALDETIMHELVHLTEENVRKGTRRAKEYDVRDRLQAFLEREAKRYEGLKADYEKADFGKNIAKLAKGVKESKKGYTRTAEFWNTVGNFFRNEARVLYEEAKAEGYKGNAIKGYIAERLRAAATEAGVDVSELEEMVEEELEGMEDRDGESKGRQEADYEANDNANDSKSNPDYEAKDSDEATEDGEGESQDAEAPEPEAADEAA